jgi:hypothetical protein
MSETRPTSLFEDAIDVPAWLEADASRTLATRRHRDRQIGRTLTGRDDVVRVRSWWQRVERPSVADLPGHRLAQARRLVSVALAGVGLASGIGLALAAYRYDGRYPVNVVRVLAILVMPQLALLLLNLILLPGRMPGLRWLQDGLVAINPGALAGATLRQLSRLSGSALFTWATAPSASARRFAKWQMLFWSQIAAVSMNLACLVTGIMLIAFTDLAFGWSTTLDITPTAATRIVHALAAPWQWLAPGAVPDASLIERSQYFRLEGETGFADSRALTGWWSFTLLAVACYGLLPRLIFLGVAGWRLRAATRALLLEHSAVTALLDRLATPELETRAAWHEPPIQSHAAQSPAGPGPVWAGRANGIVWKDCLRPEAAAGLLRSRLGLTAGFIAEAGSGTLAADQAALARAAADVATVVVFTPAWEPPLLEFTDFLAALRRALGPAASIVVMPVGEDLGPVDALDRDNWLQAVQLARDPRSYLEMGQE